MIHPNESFLSALRQALHNRQFEIPARQIRAFLQKTCSWYAPERSYTDQTGARWWRSFFEKLNVFYAEYRIPATEHKKLNADFRKQILDPDNYQLYEDAEDVLARCAEKGYRNYILSNNFPELPSIAGALGLSPYFDGYFISSNIGYEKPRPEIFRYALRSAGFPECRYMIGDHPVADIQGAKAAGMKTILVHQSGSADYLCKTLSEIPSLLDHGS